MVQPVTGNYNCLQLQARNHIMSFSPSRDGCCYRLWLFFYIYNDHIHYIILDSKFWLFFFFWLKQIDLTISCFLKIMSILNESCLTVISHLFLQPKKIVTRYICKTRHYILLYIDKLLHFNVDIWHFRYPERNSTTMWCLSLGDILKIPWNILHTLVYVILLIYLSSFWSKEKKTKCHLWDLLINSLYVLLLLSILSTHLARMADRNIQI